MHYALTDTEPRLQVAELKALVEVTEEIHLPKIHQEVDNFLVLGVLGLPYVDTKVSHHDGVLVPEADQGLCQVLEVLQGGGMEVCPDKWGPLDSGDDLKDYHIYPVEARWLQALALWSLLDVDAHSPLRSLIRRGSCRQTHHVVSNPVATIRLVGYFSLCQNHHIVIVKLDRPNGLGKAKDLSVADVVSTKV